MRIFARTTSAALIVLGSLLGAMPVAAQGFQLLPDRCIDQGGIGQAPGVDCLVDTMVNIGRVVFGISGSFALLMFVIGGFMYLSSAGADDKVKKGKEYIKNAVIGLVIILTAAYGIEYGANVLRQGGATACKGTVYTEGTQQACCEGGVVVTLATGSSAGTQKCVKGTSEAICQQIDPGYSCGDITNRKDGGANCVRGVCPGADNIRCCPPEN